jgi:hypothetical protein
MKIKKNTFSTLVLELFFPSIANCRKLKIKKNQKIDFPYCTVGGVDILVSISNNLDWQKKFEVQRIGKVYFSCLLLRK